MSRWFQTLFFGVLSSGVVWHSSLVKQYICTAAFFKDVWENFVRFRRCAAGGVQCRL